MFNEGMYWELVCSRKYTFKVIRDGEPEPDSNEPPGTRSWAISIRDEIGIEVVQAHMYKRPGWVIGASGKPDPKRIYKDGKLYRKTMS
jgi:hypothetical protein